MHYHILIPSQKQGALLRKGYEQSFDQIILKKMPEAHPDNSKGKLQCVQIGTTATIQGENFTVKVTDGKIVSLRFDGKEYLKLP